jgi:FkbM family methyltransferase
MDDLLSCKMTSAMLNEDARFIFPSNDNYWSLGVTVGQHLYEPEIDWVLRRAINRPYALLDCGSNMGYWSILASSAPYGRHPAVAIEASRRNFQILLMNSQANNGRFIAIHRAVLDEAGKQVQLHGTRHYSMSLRKDWHPIEDVHVEADNSNTEEVESMTIDLAAEVYLPNRQYPALIKIDVEGLEIEAIKGAHHLIEEGALFIYEDHGTEATHAASRFVLCLQGVDVWHVAPDHGSARITKIEQVSAIKQDARMGYNFFAHKRASPWSSLFDCERASIATT